MLGRFFVLWVFSALGWAQLPAAKLQRQPPEQPLPFSHKTHTAQGLKCAQCHPIPEPGDFATLPASDTCMACHASVKKDSPDIAKLAALHAANREIEWKPVYRIPDWVSFNHRKHISIAGISCESCHGPVAERHQLAREKDLSMQACMDCHRTKGASNHCLLCHEQR